MVPLNGIVLDSGLIGIILLFFIKNDCLIEETIIFIAKTFENTPVG